MSITSGLPVHPPVIQCEPIQFQLQSLSYDPCRHPVPLEGEVRVEELVDIISYGRRTLLRTPD